MAVASAVGTTVEWDDFLIFSTAVPLVFATQFFTGLSPASGVLAGFATLGVGIVGRPLGGTVWGHFGDRHGRKTTRVASLLVMGAATLAVGLLPTYDRLGVLAPALLVVARLQQGLSAGGEWAGAAFLASVVLVVLGLVVRLSLVESPVFREMLRERGRSRHPVAEVCRERPRELVLASLNFVANTAVEYVFLAYLLAYAATVLEMPRDTVLGAVVVGSVVWLVTTVLSARWSDRVGRKPVMLTGSVLLVVWAFPFFLLVDTRFSALLVVAVVVLGTGLGISYGPQAALFAELVEPRYRYSGAS